MLSRKRVASGSRSGVKTDPDAAGGRQCAHHSWCSLAILCLGRRTLGLQLPAGPSSQPSTPQEHSLRLTPSEARLFAQKVSFVVWSETRRAPSPLLAEEGERRRRHRAEARHLCGRIPDGTLYATSFPATDHADKGGRAPGKSQLFEHPHLGAGGNRGRCESIVASRYSPSAGHSPHPPISCLRYDLHAPGRRRRRPTS